MSRYSIGVDFGTLSGRAVLVDVSDGRIAAQSVREYSHGVMSSVLPSGKKLGSDWALQHPMDYLDVFYETIPDVLNKSGVDSLLASRWILPPVLCSRLTRASCRCVFWRNTATSLTPM